MRRLDHTVHLTGARCAEAPMAVARPVACCSGARSGWRRLWVSRFERSRRTAAGGRRTDPARRHCRRRRR
jgi:hypothetical protein